MLIIKKLVYFFLFIILNLCHSKVNSIEVGNVDLTLKNELLLYKKKPYSGILFSKTDTLTTYQATYENGVKHGKEQKFFYNGNLAELRFYTKGNKSGIHKAWWNNGQLMFEHHFNDSGEPINILREWHTTGQLLKEMNYLNGKKDGTQKSWDYTGEIIANYIVINGEPFGLIGSDKCKPDGYVD